MGVVAVSIKTLRTMCGIAIGVGVFFAGMGATLAFGVLAFIGMPMLVVGLGLLSAAIDDIESP
jgi:hypothetical protein